MSVARAQKAEPLLEETLNLLSNVMFPVAIFLIWAFLTTIGTIVDQNRPQDYYYENYPLWFANVVVRLHLTNIYHSVPYIALVVLLLLSMSVCTFRRVIPKRFPKDRAVPIVNFGLHDRTSVSVPPADAAGAAQAYLRSRGFAMRSQTIDGAHWLFGDKQKWARYGVLVAHLGFAVIAFGVFLGWLRGYSGQLVIFNGESANVPQAGLRMRLDKFTPTFVPVQSPAGITYQAVKFQSDVTVTHGDGSQKQAHILVNHPYITPDGVYFYQASYSFAGNLQITKDGQRASLPGTDGRLQPQDAIFLPGTSRAIEYGTLLGPTDPSQTPPGIELPKQDEYAIWVFHDNIPTTNRPILLPVGRSVDVGDGYRVTALPPRPSSGLTYRYDPGQGWVGLGALILVGGFVMALFFVPVKVYAKVWGEGLHSTVEIAATTTKGNTIYENEFASVCEGLRQAISPPVQQERGENRVSAYV